MRNKPSRVRGRFPKEILSTLTECIQTIMNKAPAGVLSFGGLITFSLFCALAPPAASLRPACGRAASFAARRRTCGAAFGTRPLPTLPQHTPPQHQQPQLLCRVAAVAPASRESPCGVVRTEVRGLRPLGVGLRPDKGNYSRPLRGLARRFASHQSSAPSAVAPPSRPLTAPHTARRV